MNTEDFSSSALTSPEELGIPINGWPQLPPTTHPKPDRIEAALAMAARNGGLLMRMPDGSWRGADSDVARASAEIIASLVEDGGAVYTRFREGTKAGIEVRCERKSVYANYQIR
jgi:hypothetical protein